MYGGHNDPVPADKIMKLFIIQCISSFVANDYDSGVHFLGEIKKTYAEKMSSMNPTLKVLAREIIKSVDMFAPDSSTSFEPIINLEPEETETQSSQHQQTQPDSVTSELQELLRRRRANRKD